MRLEELGYDDLFEEDLKEAGPPGCAAARVVARYRGAYRVRSLVGECLAEIAGKLEYTASSGEDFPAVGDWVAVTGLEAEPAVIHGVLPRRTVLKRKHPTKPEAQVLAANVDVAFIIESADRDFNLNRFERYLAMVRDGGVEPAFVINKADLVPPEGSQEMACLVEERSGGSRVILTSTVTGDGLDELQALVVKGRTCCFLGSSGVGKSSLINRLLGGEAIRTAEISARTGRGTHTTTSREMHFMESGGMVIDTPGLREIGMLDSNPGIEAAFGEVARLAGRCAFRDCTHAHEPGCAVREAVEAGELDVERLASYAKLKKEAEYYEMTGLEKRKKDRDFGKYVKSVKKQIMGPGTKGNDREA